MADPLITVVHPAPVRMVLRGGRRSRLRFLALATPVRPACLGAGEMRLAHVPEASVPKGLSRGGNLHAPLYEARGRLWVRAHAGQGKDSRPMSLDDLSASLASGVPPARWRAIDRFLLATPAIAWTPVDDGGLPGGAHVGAAALPEGRAVEDLSDAARSGIAGLFEDRILVAGGIVHHAFEGYHGVLSRDGTPVPEAVPTAWTAYPRNLILRMARDSLCVRADRLAPRDGTLAMRAVATRDVANADVAAHANAMPSRLMVIAMRTGVERDATEARLAGLAARGAAGLIDGPSLNPALLACREAAVVIGAALAERQAFPLESGYCASVIRYVEDVALPALDPRDPMDEEAFADI